MTNVCIECIVNFMHELMTYANDMHVCAYSVPINISISVFQLSNRFSRFIAVHFVPFQCIYLHFKVDALWMRYHRPDNAIASTTCIVWGVPSNNKILIETQYQINKRFFFSGEQFPMDHFRVIFCFFHFALFSILFFLYFHFYTFDMGIDEANQRRSYFHRCM